MTTSANRQTLISSFHERQLGIPGIPASEHYRVCGWSSRESQVERFAALTRNLPFQGGTVVDYGCGTGDLFPYLQTLGLSFEYTGLDFHSGMLAMAKASQTATFLQIDFDAAPPFDADYIFASGVFQFRDPENPTYYEHLLRKLFARCRIGLAINFLSAQREDSQKDAKELYLEASILIDLAKSLSGRWALDHSYHPGRGDMTLTILKQAADPTWSRPAF